MTYEKLSELIGLSVYILKQIYCRAEFSKYLFIDKPHKVNPLTFKKLLNYIRLRAYGYMTNCKSREKYRTAYLNLKKEMGDKLK